MWEVIASGQSKIKNLTSGGGGGGGAPAADAGGPAAAVVEEKEEEEEIDMGGGMDMFGGEAADGDY